MLFADAIVFGLRLNEGVDLEALARRFFGNSQIPASLTDLKARLEEADYLAENVHREAGRLALNARGRLVADAVAEAVLEALDD